MDHEQMFSKYTSRLLLQLSPLFLLLYLLHMISYCCWSPHWHCSCAVHRPFHEAGTNLHCPPMVAALTPPPCAERGYQELWRVHKYTACSIKRISSTCPSLRAGLALIQAVITSCHVHLFHALCRMQTAVCPQGAMKTMNVSIHFAQKILISLVNVQNGPFSCMVRPYA